MTRTSTRSVGAADASNLRSWWTEQLGLHVRDAAGLVEEDGPLVGDLSLCRY
jgi:hypothetical protein